MDKHFNLIGVGIGPFNLSLAAVLDKTKDVSFKFFEQKKNFNWHAEIMFSDSDMQTSYLKDLVSPVDPTSKYSFLNYLVQNGLFHIFLNTGRSVVTRREFEMYCQWVTEKMEHRLSFDSQVNAIDFDGKKFIVTSGNNHFTADNICIGTGLTPRIPDCAVDLISPNFFHAKSPYLSELNAEEKSIVIVGGGQTGVEILRNAFKGKWGNPKSVRLITGRPALQPLDESPFTNEFFTPNYVDDFFPMNQDKKTPLVKSQKLASDGNTPSYLEELYKELYQIKFVEKRSQIIEILPSRTLNKIQEIDGRFVMIFENHLNDRFEELNSDIVILCTGFSNAIPSILNPIKNKIHFDSEDRFIFNKNFSVIWNGPAENKIFALNFSRHSHGISEPQTSLMAWRSAVIANELSNEKLYLQTKPVANFMNFNL